MEVRKYPARVTFGQIGDLRLWLWIVVLPAVTLSWVIPTWRELGVGATEGARPIGQLAQDDLSAPVWSLSFSSDGAYLASATVTGDVWLKETLSGRVIRLGRGPTGSVQCLAFAPTTHVLAVAGIDPALRLWDVDTGKELAPLGIEARFAKYVAFSTDGTTLAVSLRGFHWDEGIIMLWDWRQARQLATLEGHRGDVNVLSFSAGGSRLASGDAHGVVKIWDLEAYRERSSFQANQRGGPIQAVAFTPDGTNVVTAAFCEGHVRL